MFLHWLCFDTNELYCRLLDLKVYGNVERGLPPRLNDTSHNVSGSDINFVGLPLVFLDLLQK